MDFIKYLLAIILIFNFSCGIQPNGNSACHQTDLKMKNRISKEEALKIAAQDAKTIYQDLSVYKITIILKGNNWQIDYDLVNERLRGGGPHYIISKETGEILSKRYEQ